MIVYPAIDIRGGKAVRLIEGDFDRETAFDADPVDAALRWHEQGAEWIHIVDLDGARDGKRQNQAVIERIRKAVPVKLQLGGGLRDIATIETAADVGIDRIVIGSAAITNPSLVSQAVAAFGSAIAVGLDARDGYVATQGWHTQTRETALDVAARVGAEGVQTIIFTDIGRDGRLEGPNLEALAAMVSLGAADIIASGGIGTLDDIANVVQTGASGVIIGAALYHQRITLPDAIDVARSQIGVSE
jgi:phosphoribosylformimino-5-aminoimidazole carboxamide ribotide isomerase